MANKILFIAPHRPNRSPAQRYRFEQYIPVLEEHGFECRLAFLISHEDDSIFYADGKMISKLLLMIKFFFRRLFHLFLALNYDVIFIQREAFFIGGAIFERLFKLIGKKIVFDFDDAIWLPNVSAGNRKWLWLKAPGKTAAIIKMADHVVAGNSYLAAYALQFNKKVTVIPSTVDLNYYKIHQATDSVDVINIGWSGSHTTIPYFKLIEPVFEILKEKYGSKIKFTVLGDENYSNEKLNIQGIKWSSFNEVPIINTFDIGVMPMPDDEWAKGKCAMKGIQYMALAIPTVMTAVGMNKEVIEDGVNGFLASTNEEWIEKLSLLIDDKILREKLAHRGRETTIKKYTTQAQQDLFISLLLN